MQATRQTVARRLAKTCQPKRAVALIHSTDQKPGIRRLKKGGGFVYLRSSGRRIRDSVVLQRIRSLAIPPAWTLVWICPHANGHLQATGRDARGRKQYRYHLQWRELRDQHKFDHLAELAAVLPRLRKKVQRDLRLPGMSRNRVLATVVRALEATLIRIGNDEYARTNGSFGLTTMHNGHARVKGSAVRFSFPGKSGKHHVIVCDDVKLARIVKRCQELPGRELFGYVDDRGFPRDVTSTDVNNYLRAATGENITAKDFRTWAGSLLAAQQLNAATKAAGWRPTKRAISKAVEAVSQRLGNTKTVCQRCYVHPVVLESFMNGSLPEIFRQVSGRTLRRKGLRMDEVALLQLLSTFRNKKTVD
jgi:DNA topoisomerase-1